MNVLLRYGKITQNAYIIIPSPCLRDAYPSRGGVILFEDKMSDIPFGYCQCGCGQKTSIITENRALTKDVKGQPRRFIRAHMLRLVPRVPYEERFWSKVDKRGENECWLWKGRKDKDGYGEFSIDRKGYRAHRISWQIANGRPPRKGFVIAHTPIVCHNPSCCNPNHLSEKTRQGNSDDMRIDGTVLRGESSRTRKYDQNKIDEVRALYKELRSTLKVSKLTGVGKSSVYNIVNYISWK